MLNLYDALTELFFHAYEDFISDNQIFLTKEKKIVSKRCIEERTNDLLTILCFVYPDEDINNITLYYEKNKGALLFKMTEEGDDKNSMLLYCAKQAYNAEETIKKIGFSVNKIITAVFALERLIDSYITFANTNSILSRRRCWLIYQTCKIHSIDIDVFSSTFDRSIMNNEYSFSSFFSEKLDAYHSGSIMDLPDNILEENNSDDENDDGSTSTTLSSLNSHLILFTPTTQKKTSTTLNDDCKNNR